MTANEAFDYIYYVLSKHGLNDAYEAMHVIANEFDDMRARIDKALRIASGEE